MNITCLCYFPMFSDCSGNDFRNVVRMLLRFPNRSQNVIMMTTFLPANTGKFCPTKVPYLNQIGNGSGTSYLVTLLAIDWRFNGITLATRRRLNGTSLEITWEYIGNSLAIQWKHISN